MTPPTENGIDRITSDLIIWLAARDFQNTA